MGTYSQGRPASANSDLDTYNQNAISNEQMLTMIKDMHDMIHQIMEHHNVEPVAPTEDNDDYGSPIGQALGVYKPQTSNSFSGPSSASNSYSGPSSASNSFSGASSASNSYSGPSS